MYILFSAEKYYFSQLYLKCDTSHPVTYKLHVVENNVDCLVESMNGYKVQYVNSSLLCIRMWEMIYGLTGSIKGRTF